MGVRLLKEKLTHNTNSAFMIANLQALFHNIRTELEREMMIMIRIMKGECVPSVWIRSIASLEVVQ